MPDPAIPTDAATTQIEAILRRVDREVWVITSAAGERQGALVATWVARASLDPAQPMLVVALAPHHFTTGLVRDSGSFTAHLLAASQVELALSFGSTSGHSIDKLSGVPVTTGVTGSPRLRDCLAWLECRVLWTLDVGDRLLFWADIVAAGQTEGGAPLRESELMQVATSAMKAQLKEGMERDITALRPLHAAWRRQVLSVG